MGATATNSRSPFESKVIRMSARDFNREAPSTSSQPFFREDDLKGRIVISKDERPFSNSPFATWDRWQPSLTNYRE